MNFKTLKLFLMMYDHHKILILKTYFENNQIFGILGAKQSIFFQMNLHNIIAFNTILIIYIGVKRSLILNKFQKH